MTKCERGASEHDDSSHQRLSFISSPLGSSQREQGSGRARAQVSSQDECSVFENQRKTNGMRVQSRRGGREEERG